MPLDKSKVNQITAFGKKNFVEKENVFDLIPNLKAFGSEKTP